MITVEIVFLLLGVFCLFAGIKGTKFMLSAGLAMIGGVIAIAVFGMPSRNAPRGNSSMVMFGLILISGGIVRMIQAAKKGSHKAKRDMTEEQIKRLAAFYDECLKHGIDACENEKQIQKATLIAQQMGFQFDRIQDLFTQSKKAKAESEQTAKASALETQKEQERKALAFLTQYAGHSGREKQIAMLTALRSEALANADASFNGAAAVIRASQTKEKDWAVLGGIAEGIGGIGAGIATAIDAQAKNAQIREQNQANLKAIAPITNASIQATARYKRDAEYYAKEIENAKTKLVANDPAASCLEKLIFSDTKISVSETGSCTVETMVSANPFFIFDDVAAVVDGTVIAKIYDDGHLIGTAQMVLPVKGTDEPAPLKGMCLFCAEPNKQYRIEFAAVNLWAMEK